MRGYTSNSSIHLYIISHFFPICKTFFEKNKFFRIFVIFLPFYRKNQENEEKRTYIVKCFKKIQKNLLTTLDNCDKILNCIIIAYYAHFCSLHIEYVGKSYNKRRVEIEFISFLFIKKEEPIFITIKSFIFNSLHKIKAQLVLLNI